MTVGGTFPDRRRTISEVTEWLDQRLAVAMKENTYEKVMENAQKMLDTAYPTTGVCNVVSLNIYAGLTLQTAQTNFQRPAGSIRSPHPQQSVFNPPLSR